MVRLVDADFETGDLRQITGNIGQKWLHLWTTGYGTVDTQALLDVLTTAELVYGPPPEPTAALARTALQRQVDAITNTPVGLGEGNLGSLYFCRFFGIKDETWWDVITDPTTLALSGNGSGRTGWLGQNGGARARLVWGTRFAAYDELYTRFYFRPIHFDTTVEVFRYWTAGGYYIIRLDLQAYPSLPSDGWIRIAIGDQSVWWPRGQSGVVGIGAGVPWLIGKWYCIEIRYLRGVPGGAQVWIDGNIVINAMNYDTTNGPPIDDSIQVGLNTMGQLDGPNDPLEAGVIYDLDDIAIDTSYIGPRTVGPTHILTVDSSPRGIPFEVRRRI